MGRLRICIDSSALNDERARSLLNKERTVQKILIFFFSASHKTYHAARCIEFTLVFLFRETLTWAGVLKVQTARYF